METTSNVLMIKPVNFAYNYETSLTNAFQRLTDENDENVHIKALEQFENLVKLLRENGIDVTCVTDTVDPHTPDSIFPNNWISFYDDGTVCLHPMYSINRRAERKKQVLAAIHEKFYVSDTFSMIHYEQANEFLEGTGSVVLDRKNRIAYACLSPRTHPRVLESYCALLNYTRVSFHAVDSHGRAIYHTNVMMSVADRYAIICIESIRSENERMRVLETLASSGKDIILIDINQMCRFAGNVLQLKNSTSGEKILFMSTQAFNSLRGEQIERIKRYNQICHSNVDIIEINGGGGVRCMLAEIFLPRKPVN